ncbi:MAG: ATP-dependent DNA helicase, partial [Moorellaceae bacterium]
ALFSKPDIIVIDEAHRFEEAAAQMLGSAFTFNDIKRMPKLVNRLEQLLMYHITSSKNLEPLGWELIRGLSSAVQWKDEEESGRAFIEINNRLLQDIEEYLEILSGISKLVSLADTQRQKLPELAAVSEKVSATMKGLINSDSFVCWAQMKGRKVESFNAIPRDMSKKLNNLLWNHRRPVILTSATLTGNGPKDYSYWVTSLGISNANPMNAVNSPFDFRKNRIVYLPPLETIPDHNSEEFLEFATNEVAKLVKVTGGRTLILLTSYKDMYYISRTLRNLVPDYNLLIQGQEQEARLVERFKQLPHSVLLGTAYWEGLDISGPALTSVICIKLPFPPPDPVLEAKAEEAKNRGLDPFTSVYLSAMLIKLKQGIGRLIRTSEDYGVFSILDKRAHLGQKSYSALIHAQLKPSEITDSLERVKSFISSKEQTRFRKAGQST